MTTTSDMDPKITLGAAAALASGRALWVAQAEDEAGVRALCARLEAAFGPSPHVEVIETDGEPFEVRALLPGLSLAQWEALGAGELHVALPDGTREAIDSGLLVPDLLHSDAIVALSYVDAEGGGSLRLERVRTRVADDEPDLASLAAELVAALRAIDPALALRSDRGADTLQPFVHPHTGRYGVEVNVEGRDPDALLAARSAILDAVAHVIAERADHPRLSLAPDPWWDPTFGLGLLLWVVGPPAAARPTGSDCFDGWPAIDPLAPAWSTLFDRVEIQVLPRSPADYDEVVLSVSALAESLAVPLSGGRARWIGGRFATGWDAPVIAGIDEAVAAIRAVDGVLAVRAVPGGPFGFHDWPWSDVAWWPLADGFAMRIHDGRTDRDALPMDAPREPDVRDVRAIDALVAACADQPEEAGGLRTVVDGAGRPGIELVLPREAHRADVLERWLHRMGRAGIDEGTGVWFVGWRGDAPHAYRFWPHTPDAPPPWGPLPSGANR